MSERNTPPTPSPPPGFAEVTPFQTQPVSRASSAASPPMSTPPTSVGDELSISSDATKIEPSIETSAIVPGTPTLPDAPATGQSTPDVTASGCKRPARSTRNTIATYNVQILAGTAIHTPTKYLEKHHGNVLHGALEDALPRAPSATPPKRRRSVKTPSEDSNDPAEAQLADEAAQAAQRRKSSRVDLRKEALRNLTAGAEAVAFKVAEQLTSGKNRLQNALGASFGSARAGQSASAAQLRGGRTAGAAEETEPEEEQVFVQPKTKQWEKQGLYVGQHREFDPRLKESQNRRRRQSKKDRERTALPLPMFGGDRLLNGEIHRDYKLPYDVYHPLPRKVKVDGWVKLHKNRFIGDASALWKRDKQDASKCYCIPEEGCGDACHNRIMAYECDMTNCPLTPNQCGNRPFAQLKARAKGNGYDYGVEVMETGDKGYGVRAMRMFEPHQIIVEYAGEIITQTECERRMKQVYKKDKCYYLMSFDNKMIIDATRGTIARFVNHSCEPNCEMIKWTVGGEPRMALFAGARGIMTGEELTYDYNFDPFSQKNIQECRCGTRKCRGVLGPKPKHQYQPKEEKSLASSLIAGTKRKFQELIGGGSQSSSVPSSPHKKPKLSYMANAALTKARNAQAAKEAADEQAKREAAEKEAQKASRESRMLSRTNSETAVSKTHKAKIVHKHSRVSLPAVKSTRKTTVSVTKTGSPKATPTSLRRKSLPTRFQKPHALSSEPASKSKSKPSSSSKQQERSPSPMNVDESSEENFTPNITPAALRSGAKKNLVQTKLPFKSVDETPTAASRSLKKTYVRKALASPKKSASPQKLASPAKKLVSPKKAPAPSSSKRTPTATESPASTRKDRSTSSRTNGTATASAPTPGSATKRFHKAKADAAPEPAADSDRDDIILDSDSDDAMDTMDAMDTVDPFEVPESDDEDFRPTKRTQLSLAAARKAGKTGLNVSVGGRGKAKKMSVSAEEKKTAASSRGSAANGVKKASAYATSAASTAGASVRKGKARSLREGVVGRENGLLSMLTGADSMAIAEEFGMEMR